MIQHDDGVVLLLFVCVPGEEKCGKMKGLYSEK
jgi:hypothetical protein